MKKFKYTLEIIFPEELKSETEYLDENDWKKDMEKLRERIRQGELIAISASKKEIE